MSIVSAYHIQTHKNKKQKGQKKGYQKNIEYGDNQIMTETMTETIWTHSPFQISEYFDTTERLNVLSYDGGTVINTKICELDNGFSDIKETNTFVVVKKNHKIGIFLISPAIGDDDTKDCWLFCDYLRNKEELNLFFDSLYIDKDIIDRQYRRHSKDGYAEHLKVCFDVEEIINNNTISISFSYGSWFTQNWKNEEKYDEWRLDESRNNRDNIIKIIDDYIKHVNIEGMKANSRFENTTPIL